jgi:hypothetical protein
MKGTRRSSESAKERGARSGQRNARLHSEEWAENESGKGSGKI